jgi:hypothetical protein
MTLEHGKIAENLHEKGDEKASLTACSLLIKISKSN